jgi:AraC-like DNA-binding protein
VEVGRTLGDVAAPVTRLRVRTSDPDEAARYLRAYGLDRAQCPDRAGFRFAISASAAGCFAIGSVRHTARLRARAEPPAALTIVEAVDGVPRLDTRRGRVQGRLLIAPYRAGYLVDWPGTRLRITTLDWAEVARVAAETSGTPGRDVRFDDLTPLSSGLARYWQELVDHVDCHLLAHDRWLAHPTLRREVGRHLITAALCVFPNSTHDRPAGAGSGEPAEVARAVEFIAAHADRHLDPAEIAQAAGTGPCALEQAFRRHLDRSPADQVRHARLARVHHDLTLGDPDRGDTVPAIAAGCGFGPADRFAEQYQHRYRCPPGETLRR